MEKTVIRNAYVASQDPLIGNQADLDVLIEGNRIAAVGRDLEVGDAAVVDATGCIVMPGFVDAHRHIWQGASVACALTGQSRTTQPASG